MPRKTAKQMRGDQKVRVAYGPLGRQLEDAMDPAKAPGKVRTWAEMSASERLAISASLRRK